MIGRLVKNSSASWKSHNGDLAQNGTLELRYRLMPYLYSVVREGSVTDLPILRAFWLHDPGDPATRTRGDAFLFGPDILVSPVTEKGAVSRSLYLPRGGWYDYWTDQRVEGGREIRRPENLVTLPFGLSAHDLIAMPG